MLLLNALLYSLNTLYGGSIRGEVDVFKRVSMVKVIRNVRAEVLPQIKIRFMENHTKSVRFSDHEFADIARSFVRTSMENNVSKIAAICLSKIVYNYIFIDRNLKHCLSKCENIISDPNDVIFSLAKCTVAKSYITSGLILSNVPKIFPSNNNGKLNVVMWSKPLMLTKPENNSLPNIETSNKDIFIRSMHYHNTLFMSMIESFKKGGVDMIISSSCFPDWAVATCKRFGVALVDGIVAKQFETLCCLLKVSPITTLRDENVAHFRSSVQFKLDQLGQSIYLLIILPNISQIILCSQTSTQCKGYIKAVIKTCKQFHQWITNSLEYQNVMNNSKSFPDEILYSDFGGSLGILLMSISTEISKQESFQNELSLLKELFLTIPRVCFNQANNNLHYSFFQHCLDFRNNYNSITCGVIENPFAYFHALETTLQEADSITRIHKVLSTTKRIKTNVE